MKDAWGQEIEVGDIVVYPSRHSSSMWLTRAVVVEIIERKRHWASADDDKEQTVRVRRLCEARYGRTFPAEDQQKVFTIDAPERLTRVGRRF